jgi:hypothetical protein
VRTWFSLIDKVYRLENLHQAYRSVRSNRGAPGIDGETVEAFGKHLEERLNRIHLELKTNRYQPSEITPPWGLPISVSAHDPSFITPALRNIRIRSRIVPSLMRRLTPSRIKTVEAFRQVHVHYVLKAIAVDEHLSLGHGGLAGASRGYA